jgi:hypothetical protein
MLKQSLLYLSQSPTAKRMVTGTPVSRQMAQRFVAGDTLEEAVQAARVLNDAGLSVSLDYLGEAVESLEEAESATEMVIRILERVKREELDSNVSVKPTQFGLDLDPDLCRRNIEMVLQRARELGDGAGEIFVRLDMESSEYTERTVALVEALWADGFHNTGTVLQSYLRRTPDDVERMIALKARVRLGKGRVQGAGHRSPSRTRRTRTACSWRRWSASWTPATTPPSPRTTRRSSTPPAATCGRRGSPRTPSSSRCCTASAATCRRGCARRGTTCACTCPSARAGTRT